LTTDKILVEKDQRTWAAWNRPGVRCCHSGRTNWRSNGRTNRRTWGWSGDGAHTRL
jgi:hypothetical protein